MNFNEVAELLNSRRAPMSGGRISGGDAEQQSSSGQFGSIAGRPAGRPNAAGEAPALQFDDRAQQKSDGL